MLEISQRASKQVQGVKLGRSFKSKDGTKIYHLSIIDYLQKYDIFKKVERAYKICFNGAVGKELSSMPSEPYTQRFMAFMKDKVLNYQFNHQPSVEAAPQDFAINELQKPNEVSDHFAPTSEKAANRVSENILPDYAIREETEEHQRDESDEDDNNILRQSTSHVFNRSQASQIIRYSGDFERVDTSFDEYDVKITNIQ